MIFNLKVLDIKNQGRWNYPPEFYMLLQRVVIDPNNLPWPSEDKDTRVWNPTHSGSFIVASSFELIREHFPKVQWSKWVWKDCIHPRMSSQVWKILSGSCATDDKIKKCGVHLTSRCCYCEREEENIDHLMWNCKFSLKI
ncbi:Reverse transcriptase zinc-binding domain [Macleaya cordata]|uniref:Reverse transcriptase zinc-binding domain n=1 Tax=Macleaya cordata TaxID=56857 RepID=A0A200R3D8_MACCD|nr:Reverse transcriptase zinc-binding domain [Macleaya cordata]